MLVQLTNFVSSLFEAIPVLDTAIYANNDVLFNPVAIALPRWPKDGSPLRGEITHVQVLDEDFQSQAMDLIFQRVSQNLGTINLAASISDANARDIIGHIPVVAADFKSLVGSSQAVPQFQRPLAFELPVVAGVPTLYMAAMLRSGTPTYTASGMRVRLGINFHNIEQF